MFDYISDGRSPNSDQIARVVLERNKRGGRVDAVLALVRSAPDPHAAAILKERLEEEFIQPLAATRRSAPRSSPPTFWVWQSPATWSGSAPWPTAATKRCWRWSPR